MYLLISLLLSNFFVGYNAENFQTIFQIEENIKDFYNENIAINSLLQTDDLPQLRCKFTPGLIVGNRKFELECCKTVRPRSSINYLEILRQWNCPQLHDLCEYQRYASFTTLFSELIYNYYCNYTAVVETCFTQVLATVSAAQQRSKNLWPFIDYTAVTSRLTENKEASLKLIKWKNLTSLLHPSLLTIDELKEPCIAIAQYETDDLHNGGYQETFYWSVFTQEIAHCGFDAEAFRVHRISILSCFSFE